MDLAARVAYLQSQTVCALAELEAMKAANAERTRQGMPSAFFPSAFSDLSARFGIDHNAVISYLRD